jgi:hypothetical protein
MWALNILFNPLLCFLATCMIPLEDIRSSHQSNLLAALASAAGGSGLELIVSVDAVFVLSGAVLTSFVGVTGEGKGCALS